MPYHVGQKGSHGCSGYPAIKTSTGEVMGCHETKDQAAAQIYAINRSEGNISEKSYDGCGCSTCRELNVRCEDCPVCQSEAMKMDCCQNMNKAKKPNYDNMIKPRRGGSDPANPRLYARIVQEAKDKFDAYPSAVANGWVVQEYKRRGGTYKSEDFDLEMDLSKADTYAPTAGMKSAARRALKWKEEGKATGAGTPVGWGRASDIVAGRGLSLDTVKRMYSFFSRHEVDKKGKDFYNTSNPSNGRIMWDAWGGDAGFSWSRKIVQREANKMWEGSAFDQSFKKREFNTAQRERMASSGQAMPDGSYPIANRTDLMNAIRSWGRGGADPKVKEHIKRRARALGASDMIPENWK